MSSRINKFKIKINYNLKNLVRNETFTKIKHKDFQITLLLYNIQ